MRIGITELVDAFEKINRDDTVLVIVGANFYKSGIVSPFEEQLKERMENIRDKVIFTGYVDYSVISRYYAAADVMVMPSIWDDPAPITILEAMACGKALITTDSGGIPEYVGEDNCIVVKRDGNIVGKIAEKLDMLLDNPDEIQRLGKRAAVQVSKYNRQYYYKQLIDILR